MEFSKELLTKAKSAENSAALLALAKENGMELTGELSDDELENVTGGGCRKNGHLVVTIGYSCELWECRRHPHLRSYWIRQSKANFAGCPECNTSEVTCRTCYYCKYTGGLWLCVNPKK